MDKMEQQAASETIELGTVTEETHGAAVGFEDTLGGQQIQSGLSDD